MGVELSKLSRFDMLGSWNYDGEACTRLEECSDGDFVRYDDVVDLIEAMQHSGKPVVDELCKALSDITEWTDRYTAPNHPISVIAKKALLSAAKEPQQFLGGNPL
jgi:hypothetical protein